MKHFRRRLAHGKGEPAEAYGWKPFGYADYGYPEQYQSLSSWTIWALVTWGSFAINPVEAGLLLAGSIAWSEYEARKPEAMSYGTGASWVHNVQAGYCWYHHFIKGRKELGTILGSYAEVVGDLGAYLEEFVNDKHYSHKAHLRGAAIGIAAAFLMDLWSKNKKGKNFAWWYKVIPFAVIAILIFVNGGIGDRVWPDEAWAPPPIDDEDSTEYR